MVSARFSSDLSAVLVDSMGDDMTVVKAARVSLDDESFEGAEGLINHLVKMGHHSVLEHCQFTFLIHAPIFVAREFMRHRLSFNEVSGRYTKLEGLFYVPDETRPLRNVGTSARPVMGDLDKRNSIYFGNDLEEACENAWACYELAIRRHVANEVARMVLPVNVYTKFHASGNLRQWLHFLSLRISGNGSYPQYEIEKVAEQIEQVIAERMPLTHSAFSKNGRRV